ncbi:hypothetical protein E9993_07960 [Labilibacter sediminis]|nr:hypothetical protein E9993_07960 [Labilibacter sediminis]
MKLIEQLERLERMDQLIRLKATGTPKGLAQKMRISESTLYELLNTAKELGANIKYCRTHQSYLYVEPVIFQMGYSSL